ncbi:hypothetical protein PMZ80_001141 [Knufia obscura]|uniref:Protein kinase domain-containing protein n=2 Tax=Knufia TaxID=430999 RepID=A0AAN8EQQ1_9EURO|nr:hypothetical protein PMZ80_001141 [Knufia obscura]KAK5958795.1 hypothetical protein OHC33_000638 [Knufia fluminis]
MINAGIDAWTDERIEATVKPHYIYSHLGEAANQLIPGSGEASGPTYAQCITAKAKRLFLTLIDIGLPQQIFRLIDEFYDDDYLPFAEDEVDSLRLFRNGTPSLDQLFYRQQFKYLVRVLHEGEHIRYGQLEYVPVQNVEQKAASSRNSAYEKVKLPSPVNRVLACRQHQLRDHDAEMDILSEIAAVRPLSHQHLLSVYGSYTQHEDMYVLLSPATQYNLKTFLNDEPKAFESLAKPERRRHLFTWPHCLSAGLAWLHLQGAHHGAVRPSRVLLDEQFQVSLGHFEGDDWLLASPSAKDNLEKYQYGAPEFWKRALTLQSHGTSTALLSSGGRSAAGRSLRVDGAGRGSNDGSSENSETMRSNSVESRYAFIPAFRGNSSRLQLKISDDLPNDLSYVRSNEARRSDRTNTALNTDRPNRTLSSRLDMLSKRSSMSSEGARNGEGSSSRFTYAMPVETKKAVVQSWKSSARDMQAADTFGLAAVTMDILTVLCGRSISSFAKHRASKNRQAGRGGGLADASFHANLSQIVSWAETLHKDSEKKMKKDSGKIFRLVGSFLEEILPCFDREAQKRPRTERVSEKLQRHLSDFAGIAGLHCILKLPRDFTGTNQKSKHRAESRLHVREPQQSLVEAGSINGHSVRSTYDRDQRSAQQLPRESYEQTYTTTTPSLAYSQSTARDAMSEPHRRSLEMRGEEDQALSPDVYDYYDDEWTIPEHAPVVHARSTHGRLLKDFTQDDRRILKDFTQDDQKPSPRPTTAHTDPRSAAHHTSPAYQRSTPSRTHHGSLGPYPRPEHKPPDRELPPPPPVANTSQQRGGNKPTATQLHQADVASATRMLAQTLGNIGRRQ